MIDDADRPGYNFKLGFLLYKKYSYDGYDHFFLNLYICANPESNLLSMSKIILWEKHNLFSLV